MNTIYLRGYVGYECDASPIYEFSVTLEWELLNARDV